MKNNQRKILHRALTEKDKTLFKEIPHTDLHCHGFTSVQFDVFKEFFPDAKLPPSRFKSFKEFGSFINENIVPAIKNIDVVRHLISLVFQKLIKEGIVYTEMSFDLLIPEFVGCSTEEYIEVIREEKEKVSRELNVCVEAGIDREQDPQHLMIILQEFLKNNIFGSIDLYGDEKSNPIERFIDIYKLADKSGLKLKAHVGEYGTAEDIKKAIEKLNLHAVQHGLSAADNTEAIRLIKERNICINMCPGSNIALGIVKNIKEHPIKRLFDAGVLVTVNSDDFSIFGRSVSDELIDLYSSGVFSEEEIIKIIDNGLKQIRR